MIKGMTDKLPKFPQIGTLRKGGEKVNGRMGKDLDESLRFVSNDPLVQAQFEKVYGNNPQQVQVLLPYKSAQANFDAWVEAYSAGSLLWRGDGERLVLRLRDDGKAYEKWALDDPSAPEQPEGGKQVGRLQVIVPALNRLGYVTVLTSSKHDIMNLHSTLSAMENLAGTLTGIQFTLKRVPSEISTPTETAKRARRTKWLLHLEPSMGYVSAQLDTLNTQYALLPAPEEEEAQDYEIGEMVLVTGNDATVTAVFGGWVSDNKEYATVIFDGKEIKVAAGRISAADEPY
jgi:hypothetical protein